jgi:diacylglycerol kinase family enzyme
MQRARLIVNPQATATSPRARDVITQALGSTLALDVAPTQGRGHAAELAYEARQSGVEVVLVLGGDGTVNEVVNGLLADGADVESPMLGVVPGGSTNVFARAIGMPEDHLEATGLILELLREGHERTIGLGRVDQRWFTFTAGLGFDADVVARIERKRAAGRRSSHGLYVRTAVVAMARPEARRAPALTLTGLDDPVDDTVGLLLVGNTSPWTYLGRRPVDPFPGASFDLGLDLLALRRLGLTRTLRAAAQALGSADHPPTGRNVLHRHDLAGFTATADAPVPLQVDGDYVGTATAVRFSAVAKALRVLARQPEPPVPLDTP